jgi:glutaredoxin 2
MEIDETVKDRRITKPQHIRQLITEQINLMRKIEPANNKEAMDIARHISNLSNTSLMAMRDGEAAERLRKIEDMLEKIYKEDDTNV